MNLIFSVHSSEEYLEQKANSVFFKFTAVNEDCIDKIIKKLNQIQAQVMITFQISSLNMPELF